MIVDGEEVLEEDVQITKLLKFWFKDENKKWEYVELVPPPVKNVEKSDGGYWDRN